MALKKQQRLTGASAVSNVFRGARPLHEGGLSMRVIRNASQALTCAVVVPVAVESSAVQRNRLRRRVVECVRLALREYPIFLGASVVVTVRNGNMAPQEIRAAFVLLLKKSGILHT